MIRVLIVAIFLICFISCQKKEPARDGILGKWKLTESLADPGDGSGKWMPADQQNPSFIEFKEDGSLVFTPSDNYSSDHYQPINDSSMIFLRGGEPFRFRYSLSPGALILYPPCIEPCGSKYIAVE